MLTCVRASDMPRATILETVARCACPAKTRLFAGKLSIARNANGLSCIVASSFHAKDITPLNHTDGQVKAPQRPPSLNVVP